MQGREGKGKQRKKEEFDYSLLGLVCVRRLRTGIENGIGAVGERGDGVGWMNGMSACVGVEMWWMCVEGEHFFLDASFEVERKVRE